MKKILVITLSLMAGTMLSNAQGLIKFFNLSATFLVSTNTSFSTFAGGTQTGGVGGVTAGSPSGQVYYYQLLIAPMGTFSSGSFASTNPLASGWTAPAGYGLATNFVGAGTLAGPGGNSGTGVSGWANGGPGATSDTQGTEMDYLLVGWSANLGNSWASVSNLLASGFTGNSIPNAFFGVSQLGFGYSGGSGTPATGPESLFGVTAGMPGGLTSGFTMYAVPTPEPGTIALAGLGGLSMLLFRRRK